MLHNVEDNGPFICCHFSSVVFPHFSRSLEQKAAVVGASPLSVNTQLTWLLPGHRRSITWSQELPRSMLRAGISLMWPRSVFSFCPKSSLEGKHEAAQSWIKQPLRGRRDEESEETIAEVFPPRCSRTRCDWPGFKTFIVRFSSWRCSQKDRKETWHHQLLCQRYFSLMVKPEILRWIDSSENLLRWSDHIQTNNSYKHRSHNPELIFLMSDLKYSSHQTNCSSLRAPGVFNTSLPREDGRLYLFIQVVAVQ